MQLLFYHRRNAILGISIFVSHVFSFFPFSIYCTSMEEERGSLFF
jgi:hypothetical protein